MVMLNMRVQLSSGTRCLIFLPCLRLCYYSVCKTYADPESFVRGGPTLTIFFVVVELIIEEWDPNTTISGHRRPARETPFKIKSCFAGVLMMTQH